MNVERVNGLIYAVVMESRGIYMSPDIPGAKRYGDAPAAIQRAHRQRRGRLAQACGRRRRRAVRRIRQAHPAVHGIPQGAGRGSAAKSARPRAANGATTKPTAACAPRSTRISTHWRRSTTRAPSRSMPSSKPASRAPRGCSALLAIVCVRPRGRGHRHHRSRGGAAARRHHARDRSRSRAARPACVVPHADRQDEVGALARSIVVFQQAMRAQRRTQPHHCG